MKTYILTFGSNVPNSSETKRYQTQNTSVKAIRSTCPIPYGYYLKSVELKKVYHTKDYPFFNSL